MKKLNIIMKYSPVDRLYYLYYSDGALYRTLTPAEYKTLETWRNKNGK
jgi:hypothetical protein